MLKFNRKHKKLVIPVGINPSYNIDSSTLYNISDATANANDIVSGKVAYGSDGKIVGSLDINERVQESYNEGVQSQKSKLTTITITENGTYSREDGYNEVIVEVPDINGSYDEGYSEGVYEQKSKLTTITITENGTYSREDGYNEVIVEVPDLNGNYDEGYSEGVAVGREEIINEQSDATITPQTVLKGEIGYGSNNERIVGEFEFVEGFNYGKIGYSQELSKELNRDTSEKLAYSKSLYDAWDPNRTSAQYYFQNDSSLVYAPNVNCSNIVDGCQGMFRGCINLTLVPALNSTNCKYFNLMFSGCSNLSNVGLIDTSSALSMDNMFYECSSLTSIPLFDTSNVNSMNYMLYKCPNLSIIPDYNYDKVTNIQNFCSYSGNKSLNLDLKSCTNAQMIASYNKSIEDVSINFNDTSTNCYGLFYECDNLKNVTLKNVNMTDSRSVFNGCSKLTTIIIENVKLHNNTDSFFSGCSSMTSIPQLDTSNVVNVSNMFYGCSKLTTIPELDFSKVKTLNMFSIYTYYNSLTSLGGFINGGKGVTGSSTAQFYLNKCSVLSYDSVMNVINKAYDMTTKTDWTGSAEIVLHSNVYSLLSPEDIAIATSKGWIIKT